MRAQPVPSGGQPAARADLLAFFGTTLLSAWILSNGLTALLSVTLLAVLLFVLWPNREHLPDAWAGLYLRLSRIKQLTMGGAAAKVVRVSWLTSMVESGGMQIIRRNRDLLSAALKQAASVSGSPVETPPGSGPSPSPVVTTPLEPSPPTTNGAPVTNGAAPPFQPLAPAPPPPASPPSA